MVILERVLVVLLEMVAEALLLGVLFCLLLGAEKKAPAFVWLIAALPVVLVLYLYGYYLSRPLLGIIWKNGPSWHYATIAALLYITHIDVAIALFSHDNITPEARRSHHSSSAAL